MSIIQIVADSRGRGTCRSCGAAIEWAETVRGKRMPFDPPIVPVRTLGSLLEGDGRVIEEVDTAVSVPHWATCPEATTWRRGR